MMIDRKQWRRVEAVVRTVILKWDPYGLIGDGAPADEWDDEILKVARRVNGIKTPSEASAAISEVFSRAFQPEGFQPEDCTQVGQQLFDELKNNGLI